MKITLLTLTFITLVFNAFSWGPDVLVGPQATGKASLVSTANGTLYCSIPAGTTGAGGFRIYKSTDGGQSWMLFRLPEVRRERQVPMKMH